MKTYNLTLDSEQVSYLLKVLNLRGNQLMSRHTKGADFELGKIDSLSDCIDSQIETQKNEFNSTKGN
jgi:hypothetical protein